LPASGSLEIAIGLKAGADFTLAKIDGYIFGGIAYLLDPNLKTPPVEVPPGRGPHKGCNETAHHLLECLKPPCGEVQSVCVKKMTVEIELKSCDC